MAALDRISVAAIGNSVADLESEAKAAEAAGIECLWAPELFRSSVTQAAFLAARTKRIDVADGLVGHPIQSLRWIEEVVIDGFETGLSRSGRDRSDFDYLPTVCCAIDDDQEKANDLARRTIAFYATVRTYRPLFEMHGFGDNATAAGEAFRKGDLAGVPAAISDEMVEAYCAAGPLDRVRERVEATAQLADGLFLTPPTYFISAEELSEYQRRIIEEFGPAAAGSG
jgi:5,10-methylenetetrahydromethanopterin reductase